MPPYSACTCHPNDLSNAPDNNATYYLGSCARTCPFCERNSFSRGSTTRRHASLCKKKPEGVRIEKGVSGPGSLGHKWKHILSPPLSTDQALQIRQAWEPWASIQLPEDLCLLSDISPATRELWDRVGGLPELLEPSSCFTPSPPQFEDIWTELVRACKSHPYDVTYKGERVDDTTYKGKKVDLESEKERLYARALLYTQRSSTQEECGIKILNIWKHGLQQRMRLPERLSKAVLEESCEFACNITPRSFTEFHHDFGQAQLIYWFGTKYWLLFPGLDENIRLYIQESVHGNTLARFLRHQPKGGILIKDNGGKVLFLPPGTLHAVETEQGAIFIGAEFSVIECLGVMPLFIRAELDVFETSRESLEQDIRKYTEVTQQTLRLRRACWTALALRSWLDVYPILSSTLCRLQGRSRDDLQSWTKDLVRHWREWAKNDASYIKACPCQPGEVLDEMGAHFVQEHLLEVMELNTNKRVGGKRKRR